MVYSSFRPAAVLLIPLLFTAVQGTVVRKSTHQRTSTVKINSHGELTDNSAQDDEHKLVPNVAAAVGAPEPLTFVISCGGYNNVTKLIERFRQRMATEGLKFEVFPCVAPTKDMIQSAIEDRLLSFRAEQGLLGSSEKLGIALSHMRLWQEISHRGIAANILEEGEVVRKGYQASRSAILSELPVDTEFVNFNPMWPEGDAFKEGTTTKDRRIEAGLPKWKWLSNYYVSTEGARRLLRIMRGFDLGPTRNVDFHVRVGTSLTSMGCKEFCHINGFLLTTNSLSVHCSDLHIPGSTHLGPVESGNATDAMCREKGSESI